MKNKNEKITIITLSQSEINAVSGGDNSLPDISGTILSSALILMTNMFNGGDVVQARIIREYTFKAAKLVMLFGFATIFVEDIFKNHNIIKTSAKVIIDTAIFEFFITRQLRY